MHVRATRRALGAATLDLVRIAMVTEAYYPAVDGTTRTVRAVVDRLVDRGQEVRLVAPGPGLADYRGCRVDRVRPHERTGAQVRAALDAFEPDLVHVTSPGRIGRRALKHARATGTPSLVVLQSPVPRAALDRWRTRVAQRADQVLVTAPWLAASLAREGIAAGVWLPGVDTAAFSPALRDPWLHARWARAGSPHGPLVVVGYVGSLHRRHGVRRLAGLARVPGIRPVLIGEGPQRDWLATRLPSAKLTGTLEPGDLAVAMASLDVLVHPGEQETCCHALREAAASGVPVVAPRSGGAQDVVRPLETGLLHEPGDPLGLVRAVTVVAGDRHRGMLGARGRELALERSWVDAADELLEEHLLPLGRPRRTAAAA